METRRLPQGPRPSRRRRRRRPLVPRRRSAAMWRAFWAGAGGAKGRLLPTPLRLALLTRTCRAILDYRCARWPSSKHVRSALDRLQRRFLSVLLRCPRLPGEEPAAFARRRGREAAAVARDAGCWGERAVVRARAWFGHLERHRTEVWPGLLLRWHGRNWLRCCAGSSAAPRLWPAGPGPVPAPVLSPPVGTILCCRLPRRPPAGLVLAAPDRPPERLVVRVFRVPSPCVPSPMCSEGLIVF